jgi:uncharacterized protein YgbK (DUF1537 family)
VAILADDFTGACDAAAPFAAAGLSTRMTFGTPVASASESTRGQSVALAAAVGESTHTPVAAALDWPEGVLVLSVDLDVRERSADEARAAARDAARALGSGAQLFLKIDSTLRGPIAALIEGALEGSGLDRAVVAAAFPEQGRDVVHGRLRVRGQAPGPLVRDVLGAAAARCSVHDSAELAAVAAVTGALLVGSSGLARRIALATPSPPDAGRGRLRPDGEAAQSTPDTVANVLVVAGSPAAATRRQLERLPRSVTVLATPASEPRASYALAASTETERRDRDAAAPAHATHDRDSGEAAAALAQRIAIDDRPDLLVLTGGQTARLVCTRLQATGVDLRGEVQPGLPFGRLQGGPWQGALVVTKAGGFGGPDALLDVLRLLGPSCLDTP